MSTNNVDIAMAHTAAPSLQARRGECIYNLLLSLDARWCGLSRRRLDTDDMQLTAYVAGSTRMPPLVLIHGFTGSKQVWSRVARGMRSRYRVIAPDLAGHGESPDAPLSRYRVEDHVQRLVSMFDRQQIESAHVAGSSFGGFIAARMAITHPSRVASLMLFDPAGIASPVPSTFDRAIASGSNPFLVNGGASFDRFYSAIMSRPPWVPRSVLSYMGAKAHRRRSVIEHMYADFAASDDLASALWRIRTPTLLVWGRDDQVIDQSAGPVWHAGIVGSQLEVWDGIGHLPMMEAPRRTTLAMLGFLESMDTTFIPRATRPS